MHAEKEVAGVVNPLRHRRIRHSLGAFVLGGLDEEEQLLVQSHVDGCATCRAECAELVPVVALLGLVDPDRGQR